jgi:hypothetical protein
LIRQRGPKTPKGQWSTLPNCDHQQMQAYIPMATISSPSHRLSPDLCYTGHDRPKAVTSQLRSVLKERRVGFDSTAWSTNPEGSMIPIAEMRPIEARKMRNNVYHRHQGSGKDVIPHQTHRGRVPKRTFTMQTHDHQEDDRYVLSTTL